MAYLCFMSGIDRFWNFKLVLKERQAGEHLDSFDVGNHVDPPISAPFVPPSEVKPLTSPIMYVEEFYFSEITDEPLVPLSEPAEVSMVAAEAVATKPFIYPTAAELDAMNIEELSRLRRTLALEIHPDRMGANSSDDGSKMGHCNQLIDDAISRKRLIGC